MSSPETWTFGKAIMLWTIKWVNYRSPFPPSPLPSWPWDDLGTFFSSGNFKTVMGFLGKVGMKGSCSGFIRIIGSCLYQDPQNDYMLQNILALPFGQVYSHNTFLWLFCESMECPHGFREKDHQIPCHHWLHQTWFIRAQLHSWVHQRVLIRTLSSLPSGLKSLVLRK